jgi:hypothetical protein
VDPVPDPQLLRKSGSAGNRTRDLWICSQEQGIKEIEVSSLGFKLWWHREITGQENLFLAESFSTIYILPDRKYPYTYWKL